MPCEPVFNKGKLVGWMCRRGRGKPKPPSCYKCGAPATCFCDHRDMEALYQTDDYGHKLRKRWVASIDTCSRPMCAACAHHYDPDTDFCDEHNSEIARVRSAKAEQLYQEQLRALGIEEEP